VRWWVLGGVAIAVVLLIGLRLSQVVVDQTQGLLSSYDQLSATEITAKDRADLIRNADQYETDNLTKLWTGIIGSLTGVAAVAAG
jgi:hypothetical protein